ncbi:MAG: GT4 family glycosyltransferase PelF [Negativicutes bacterium]|nr:GT4 family glycosyltransferase PelF [Negativicutes bacterium]
MKICMLVEGSYPYVTGGLSAWVQMMIKGMPEHQFIIYSIAAEEKDRGQFQYELPQNVIGIEEIFLDNILNLKSPRTGKYQMTPAERNNLLSLICGEGDIDLDRLLHTFRSRQSGNALEIFMSFEFFDVITSAYQAKFSRLPFTDFFWTVRSMLLPLFYLIKQDLPEADLYHSVAAGYAGAVGGMAATLYKKPFILTEHGIYSREREEEIIKCSWAKGDFKSLWINYFYSLAKLTYQKATRVFTMFEKNSEMQVTLGCDPAKIGIIPNGIDVVGYESLKQLGGENGFINIAAVVRIVPVKDIVTMLRSFYLVKQKLPNARFYIIGPYDENKEYYEECLKVAASLNIKDLEFTGSVNVREWMGKIDIMVLSSISEGQPLSILEGMASRKPFVTTDVGSCRELLQGNDDGFGTAGLVVPMMDFEEMAKAIVTLAQDKELRAEMGENGHRRISSLYTLEGFIEGYKKVYRETYAGGGV